MSVDFSKFDKLVNQKELSEQIKNADDVSFDDVPRGTYVVDIEKMEIKPTKAGDKLMFAVQMGITETIDAPKKQDRRKVFFNRVILGNKTTDKWNDGIAIKGVISWIKKLLDEDDTIEFKSYSQFADEILDIYQDVCPNISVKIDYDPEAFNPISIVEVYDN